MAVIYLRSADGSDASDGLTWANAKATLAASLTAAGAGGTVYVADGHAETQASAITLASPGTLASPVRVICVDDTGDPEPPTARAVTATVTCTGNSSMTLTGTAYAYGITFAAGTGNVTQGFNFGATTTVTAWVFEACVCSMPSTNTSNVPFTVGQAGGSTTDSTLVRLIASEIIWPNAGVGGARVAMRTGILELVYGSQIAATGTVPTTTFIATSDAGGRVLCLGADLSALASGKTIASVPAAGAGTDYAVRIIDCKLGASVTLVSGTPVSYREEYLLVNSDSADTNYRFERVSYPATETQETTIVRTGGASDGTTTFSRKVVTTANVTPHFAYETMWMEKWNETTGSSVTVTVETVTDNVTLTDAEAWLEVEYLGTSGFPLGVFTSDRVSDPVFGTPANQTSSSETWTTTGLGTPVKQRLAVSFTPQEKGIIRARVCVAKASATVYYDPLLTVS